MPSACRTSWSTLPDSRCSTPPSTSRPERWQLTLDINLSGTFYMAQAAGRVMLEAGYGRVINLASQAAVVGFDQHGAYCASKAAVVGMTHVLSLEWARHGVTVNAVSPTVVETPLGKAAWAGEKGEKAKREIPVGRFAQPEEVAALIAFLAGDDAAMITGSNYLINSQLLTFVAVHAGTEYNATTDS